MKIMNLLQLISKNSLLKFSLVFITIFFISLNAQSEIPEKYKIESSLKKCKGKDYKKWTNCYGEFVFPRNEYKGEWKNGAFHGQGVLKEAWGGIYIGGFKNNLANGYGKQEEKDGTIWECEVKDDLCNGKGKISYADGSSYEGEFKDFLYHGTGKHVDQYGSIYEGEFQKGSSNGKGVFTNWNGAIYKGNFKDGFLDGEGFYSKPDGTEVTGFFIKDYVNGQGTWKFPNGSIAKGNFKDDLLDGYGTFTWSNGDRYEGEFKKGERHGDGKIFYKNGDFFEGIYENDLPTFGYYTAANGDKYAGDYKENLEDGEGMFIKKDEYLYEGTFVSGDFGGKGKIEWINGDKYEGDFKEGYRTGKGKYTFESGSVYIGDFVKNILSGQGTFKYSDGSVYKGEMADDYENGFGELKYSNGDYYKGSFKDGYPHGKGKMVYANGDVYDGLWKDGEEAEGKKTLAKFTTDENYYALIIGNNEYDHLEDLDNAVNDAVDLEKVLKDKYGFKTKILLNAKKDETLDAIINFTDNAKKNDNLLIYYAGHGQLDKKQKRGYWLPKDSGSKKDSKWLSNNRIKDEILSSEAGQILLIVDSCFSGSLTRSSGDSKSVERLNQSRIDRLLSKKTRLVITSGGNEDVADGIGDSKNSVFAEPLIKILKSNNEVIRSYELFKSVQSFVIDNADQTPNHSTIHGTGHDGGEFLFFPIS